MCVCELERNKNHELTCGYYAIDAAGWLRYYTDFFGSSDLEKLAKNDSFIGVAHWDNESSMYVLFGELYKDYESYGEN